MFLLFFSAAHRSTVIFVGLCAARSCYASMYLKPSEFSVLENQYVEGLRRGTRKGKDEKKGGAGWSASDERPSMAKAV
jgi:hypothetical protein